jgi:multidrug efflux pump subunit AcrB
VKDTPALLESLRQRFDTFAGARITVRQFVQGSPVSAPIAIRVLGEDLGQLRELSTRVQQVIAAVPGTREVENPLRVSRTNLRLLPDAQKAALAGVTTADFDMAVRLALSGLPVGSFRSNDGELYDITLRTPVGDRAGADVLQHIRVPSISGASLPLSQFATLQFEEAPVRIQRYSRQRAVTLDAQVADGYQTSTVNREVVRALEAMDWPHGTGFVVGGEAEAGQQAFGGIGVAILVALFGVFAILVLEFGDYRSTLIVLTVVPLGVVGGMVTLLLTGNDLSFTAGVGFVALIGIEIKNSILLVDFTNQLRSQGLALDEAIEQAGEIRFLPILLTSATAIGGLLPLALQDSGLYSPLAWTIIGGLVTSTLLARLVTPVVYKLIPPAVEPA